MASRETRAGFEADRDHILKLEWLTGPLPKHRYEFLLSYVGKPKPDGGQYGYGDLGFAPYAMAEHSEMLTVNFMLWRKAREGTENERRIKRQIEQNIIHIAGLLSHFITDNANPLHTTIHGNGWNPKAANPKGYVGKRIHGRFESIYVKQSIEEPDFESLVGGAQVVGPWLDAAMKHIRAAHGHLETVYALDQQHPFGEGNETAEAKRFTCERLAHASRSLRDFWYSAWIKSAELLER